MRFWHWLTLASALLFPLEAQATIAYIKILAIDSVNFGPGDCASFCGFGTIDYEERGDGGLDKYDFHSEDWFDSSGLGHVALQHLAGSPDFSFEESVEPGVPPIYRLSVFDQPVVTEVWADAVTTDFSEGTIGFWSTGFFDDSFREVHVDFQVIPAPPPPRVPEPGSLVLLVSAFGLWFGFKLTQAHRSVRES